MRKMFMVLAVAIMAGCGSSKTEPTTTTTSTTSSTSTTSTTIDAHQPVSHSSRLTADGIAGIHIGDTVAQASAATGQKLTEAGPVGDPPTNCAAEVTGVDDISVYINGANVPAHTVYAIAVRSSAYVTDQGVHLGSSIADVRKAYPTAAQEEGGSGPRYVAKNANTHEIVMRTDGKTVTELFVGVKGVEQTDEFCG